MEIIRSKPLSLLTPPRGRAQAGQPLYTPASLEAHSPVFPKAAALELPMKFGTTLKWEPFGTFLKTGDLFKS